MSIKKLERMKRLGDIYTENINFIREFKQHPCVDCGIKYHYAVMEFDHCRGKKRFQLSQPGRRSKILILSELEKCDLVCANCHRMRTTKRSKEVLDSIIKEPYKNRLEELGLKMILDLEKQIEEIRSIIKINVRKISESE